MNRGRRAARREFRRLPGGRKLAGIVLALCILAGGEIYYQYIEPLWDTKSAEVTETAGTIENIACVTDLADLPEYDGEPYITVNENEPSFTEKEMEAEPYEYYSEMDALGRCGYAEAKISEELMPTEERGAIGMVKPSGWHTVKYSEVEGKYLYNRCHLIAYQLTGENANEKNLITGTRYFNVEGMLPLENEVADYVEETGNPVMYRVTPVYEDDNLVASGVQMEAQSVEDDGVSFNVYVFNVQPGIDIDYATGESSQE